MSYTAFKINTFKERYSDRLKEMQARAARQIEYTKKILSVNPERLRESATTLIRLAADLDRAHGAYEAAMMIAEFGDK